MKNVKSGALAAAILLASASVAQATTYTVISGEWTSTQSWSRNSSEETTPPNNSVPDTADVFDNGETFKTAQEFVAFPVPGFNDIDWFDIDPANTGGPTNAIWVPETMNGTYSGTLIVDDGTGEVTGGTLNVTGKIGNAVGAPGDWWGNVYENLQIDFSTGLASVTGYWCYDTGNGPAGTLCSGGGASGLNPFQPTDGTWNRTKDGSIPDAARLGALFDGTTLEIFRDGWAGGEASGNDSINSFELVANASVVPVPAAAWLFGSALGLLGWVRRRAVA